MLRSLPLISVVVALCLLAGCRASLPPSKPLSELTAQEMRGHGLFVRDCERCHNAGRGMMPAFGNTMDEEQLSDLLAYLHTL